MFVGLGAGGQSADLEVFVKIRQPAAGIDQILLPVVQGPENFLFLGWQPFTGRCNCLCMSPLWPWWSAPAGDRTWSRRRQFSDF